MPLTDVEKAVLMVLKVEDGRPVSRSALAAITGYTDRQNRAAVASLIDIHHVRVETSPRGGYYIPDQNDDYTAAKRFMAQAFSLLRRARLLMRFSSRAERFKLQMPLPLSRRKNGRD